jgi:6-phosphofructokinase 1
MNIAIMCSGGDSCGMNPAIKSFVDYVYEKGFMPYFIYDGFEGLIEGNIKVAQHEQVAGIMHLGGTIIRTSRSKRFLQKKYRKQAFEQLQKHDIDKIILLGGDGSFTGLNAFSKEFDISFIGIPATIDNDIAHNDYALGVDTALNVIKSSLDDIRDTSSSFKRAFVVETMGRDSGYLAIVSSITSGAEICIVPEKPANLKSLEKRLKKEIKEGRTYILAIVAEGTQQTQEIAQFLEKRLKMETRTIVLGHVQRGGNPTVYDRLMANEFVTFAVDKLFEGPIQKAIVYKYGKFDFIEIETLLQEKAHISKTLLRQLDKMTQ